MKPRLHSGPKSDKYNALESLIDDYHNMLRQKLSQESNQQQMKIRKYILLNGCPVDDFQNDESKKNANQKDEFFNRIGSRVLPTLRSVEDTLRGKLWRLMLGISKLDSNDYNVQLSKQESREYYKKIRGDTKRTFLTSKEYNDRVSEERLVRVLNSFVHRYNKPYCQGMDCIAAGLLYVMPELDAFACFSSLMNRHFPTYFHSVGKTKSDQSQRKKALIGAFAASYLAWDVLKLCDRKLFDHLKPLPPHTYLFPVVGSFQAICQPFVQLLKIWDFLFCFGVHLNPIVAAAQIIVNRQLILKQNPAQLLGGLLAQRKWMNQQLDARAVIDRTMDLIITLKQEKFKGVWQNITMHSSKFEVALSVKIMHEKSPQNYKQISIALTDDAKTNNED